MKQILIIFVAVLVSVSLLSVAPASGLQPIKIGYMNSLGGVAGEYTREDLGGFRLKIDKVNDAGGVMTKGGLRKIKVIFRDNKLKPDIAVKNAKELIFKEKCDLLCGFVSSSVLLAVSEWCKENKVIAWVSCGSRTHHATQERGHRYLFRLSVNTWMSGQSAASFFKDKPYTRWGSINQDYAFGRSQFESFVHGMKKWKPGFKIVTKQWPKFGTTDFTPYITALMARKPEALQTCLWGTDATMFIKQAKGYGLFDKMAVAGLFWGSMALLRPMGNEMVEGVYSSAEWPFIYPGSPENKAFVDAYKNSTGVYPSCYSAEGYETATFLIAGIEKAGTVETEALIDALETTCIGHIGGGKICMRKCDHQSDYSLTYGKTKKSPDWPWFVLEDAELSPGGPTRLSCEEIRALRAAAK